MIGMKYKRRRAEPPLESSMYDGSELLGTITPRAGLFAARMASGLAHPRRLTRRACAFA
jgi:hypothetical protein